MDMFWNYFEYILIAVFCISVFLIYWAMIGYNMSLKLINRFISSKKIKTIKKLDKNLTVTVMIVAHNEEKVIEDKLKNIIDNDYPVDKIKYIIASDNSTDVTNQIVMNFISKHNEIDMVLYNSKLHLGKTNAQNEAQKLVKSDILVMSDANSMFKRDTISQLVSSFIDDDIKYVSGSLQYINTDNETASLENNYWQKELQIRLLESNIKTISAGNGAVYACRNESYVDFPPIECHDSSMPYYYGKQGFRAIFNPLAIAYEKAGETVEDELKRKIRMNRIILQALKRGGSVLNPFKYGWFSYIFFGHRTARYLLWVNHFVALVSNLILAILSTEPIWKILLTLQIIFYGCAIIGRIFSIKYFRYVYYYCMTIYAQWMGVINILCGKTKATWEKAESTR